MGLLPLDTNMVTPICGVASCFLCYWSVWPHRFLRLFRYRHISVLKFECPLPHCIYHMDLRAWVSSRTSLWLFLYYNKTFFLLVKLLLLNAYVFFLAGAVDSSLYPKHGIHNQKVNQHFIFICGNNCPMHGHVRGYLDHTVMILFSCLGWRAHNVDLLQ